MDRKSLSTCPRPRLGFTIIEVMVALTITILLMAALAQSFKYLGQRMQSGRAEVELSGRVRSATVRMRDELRRVTTRLGSPLEQSARVGEGYFMYVEGPMSDSSAALYGQQTVSTRGEPVYVDSRYGDFDDYIAFTCKAPQGSWFKGKVPAFIVNPLIPAPSSALPAGQDPRFDPVEITSEYAEVIYWVSPDWQRDTLGNLVYGTDGVPLFIDNDGSLELDGDGDNNDNGLPDRMVLRRRVLLIRPDLNIDVNEVAATKMSVGSLPVPLSNSSGAAVPIANFWINKPALAGLANWDSDLKQAFNGDWLTGMEMVYQMCDLSVGRRLTATGVAAFPQVAAGTTPAETAIQANSLTDLQRPHLRFAHVRMPGEYFGLTDGRTTMPLVALTTGAAPFLSNTATIQGGSARSHLAYPHTYVTTPAPLNQNFPVLNGFLLPQFDLGLSSAQVLAGYSSNSLADPRWDRTGEDIVATGILGFDVQAYDPLARIFLANGPDGVPGPSAAGGSTLADQGSAGSDDLLITPDDPAFYDVINATEVNPSFGVPYNSTATDAINYGTFVDQGAYVDLGYAFSAGGTARDFVTTAIPAGGNVPLALRMTCIDSAFSGFHDTRQVSTAPVVRVARNPATTCADTLRRSGRAVFTGANGNPTRRLFQVAYDSYTDAYESDGVNQMIDWRDFTPAIEGYGLWWKNNTGVIDEAMDNLDNLPDNIPSTITPRSTPSADDAGERETQPPFVEPLRAVRIRIRLEDVGTQQFRQMTIVHDFPQ